VNPTSTCSDSDSGRWSAVAYAGNISSTTFRQLSDNPALETGASPAVVSHWLVTTIQSSCGIRFGKQPNDAAQGDVITGTALDPSGPNVTVEIFNGGGVDTSVDTGTVTLTTKSGSGPGVLSGDTATFTDGVATFSSLKISDGAQPAAGDYTLTATYAQFSADSDPFTIFDDELCPGADYQESSTQYQSLGGLTITPLSTESCFGVTVTDTTTNSGTEEWDVTKSGDATIKGYLDITWELPGTDPVTWTKVLWVGLTEFQDIQRCEPGTFTDETFTDQFPPDQEICLVSSNLRQSGTTWVQDERYAVNTDMGLRK
jgi:hypothetical protein